MDTPTISVGRRSRISAILVVLALAIAVSALAAQARSIWSTSPVVRPATVQIDTHASKDDMQAYWLRGDNGGTPLDRPSMREIEAKKSGR
jgi:hypothetical protein